MSTPRPDAGKTAPLEDPQALAEFETLLGHLKQSRGFDFTAYRRSSLMRRARVRMQMVGVEGFGPPQDLEISCRPFDLRSCIERAYAERRAVAEENGRWAGPGGQVSFLALTVVPLLDGTGALGVSVHFLDVSRQRRLQEDVQRVREELLEELRSTTEELATMNEELQSTSEELATINEEARDRGDQLGELAWGHSHDGGDGRAGPTPRTPRTRST